MKLPKAFTEKYMKGLIEVDTLLYVRDVSKKRVGVVIVHNGYCGWSLCDGKDKWDTAKGILKALYRVGQRKTVKTVLNKARYNWMECPPAGISKIKPRALSFARITDMLDTYVINHSAGK